MKYLLIAIAMVMVGVTQAQPSFAQKDGDILYQNICMSFKELQLVLQEFGEIPFIRGLSHRDPNRLPGTETVSLVIFLNPKTGTWTIVEKVKTDRYCILGLGDNFELAPKGIFDELNKSKEGIKL
jgi:hypothetical protein